MQKRSWIKKFLQPAHVDAMSAGMNTGMGISLAGFFCIGLTMVLQDVYPVIIYSGVGASFLGAALMTVANLVEILSPDAEPPPDQRSRQAEPLALLSPENIVHLGDKFEKAVAPAADIKTAKKEKTLHPAG